MCLFSAIKLAYHHYYRKTIWVKYDFCIFYLDTMTHQYWHLLHVFEAQLPLTRQQHYFISWPSKHLETAVFHLLDDSIHSGNVISLEWRVLNPKVGWKYPQGPNGRVIIESGIEFEQWKDKSVHEIIDFKVNSWLPLPLRFIQNVASLEDPLYNINLQNLWWANLISFQGHIWELILLQRGVLVHWSLWLKVTCYHLLPPGQPCLRLGLAKVRWGVVERRRQVKLGQQADSVTCFFLVIMSCCYSRRPLKVWYL